MKNILTLLLFFTISSLHAQVDLEDGLVAFYPFSGNFADESPFGNDAQNIAGANLTEGYDGASNGGIFFDGIDDYLDIPHLDALNFDHHEAFTISFWIKAPKNQVDTDGTVVDLVSKWNNTGNQPYSYTIRLFNQNSVDNGKIRLGIFQSFNSSCSEPDALGLSSTSSINDDSWHHVVCGRDENNMLRVYVDCNMEGELEDNIGCSLINLENLFLASRVPGGTARAFNGSIDEFRIYNRWLTADELNTLCGAVSTTNLTPDHTYSLYPNPIQKNGSLQVNSKTSPIVNSLDIYNLNGTLVRRHPPGTPLDLPSGVYFVRFLLEDKKQAIKKLIITD